MHQQQRICRHAANSDCYAFFNLLTGPELLAPVETLLPDHREQLFPHTETLSMLLAQAMSADRPCQKAVDEAAIKRLNGGLALCNMHTGAYYRARQRLPVEMVATLARHTGYTMAERTLPSGAEGALSGPLACRAGSAQHQDHLGYEAVELPHTGDDAEGDLGLSVGLQPDPTADGSVGLIGRGVAASAELQTHPANLDCLAAERDRERRR